MRFGTLIIAAILGATTVWSDRVLAAGDLLAPLIHENAKALSRDAGASQLKQVRRGASANKKTEAASAVVETAVLHDTKSDGVIVVPSSQDQSIPQESSTPILERKGVRG